jgi:mannose-6-phosphate isomerase-like protein (cupin superfamily)/ribosomal protein S18 acetylase RimI-like enzyme
MAQFHYRKLPDFSTLLAGHAPPDEVGFQSSRLQIWYNHTEASWVADGERPHKHLHSDECFIVLRGSLEVDVDGRRFTVGPRAFCCFPAGLYHAIVAVHPPVETLMIRAPSVTDKVYQAGEGEERPQAGEESPGTAEILMAVAADLDALFALDQVARSKAERRAFIVRAVAEQRAWVVARAGRVHGYAVISHDFFGRSFLEMVYIGEEHRGQGLGPALMRHLETQSRSGSLFTSTNESNRQMQHVLARLGYERSGIIHHLIPEDPEIVYVKQLAQG